MSLRTEGQTVPLSWLAICVYQSVCVCVCWNSDAHSFPPYKHWGLLGVEQALFSASWWCTRGDIKGQVSWGMSVFMVITLCVSSSATNKTAPSVQISLRGQSYRGAASFLRHQQTNKRVEIVLDPTASHRMFPCAFGTSEYFPGWWEEAKRVWSEGAR